MEEEHLKKSNSFSSKNKQSHQQEKFTKAQNRKIEIVKELSIHNQKVKKKEDDRINILNDLNYITEDLDYKANDATNSSLNLDRQAMPCILLKSKQNMATEMVEVP